MRKAKYWGFRGTVYTSSQLQQAGISKLRCQFLGDLADDHGGVWKFQGGEYRLVELLEDPSAPASTRHESVINRIPAKPEELVAAHNARKAVQFPSRYHLKRAQITALQSGQPLRVEDALGEFWVGVQPLRCVSAEYSAHGYRVEVSQAGEILREYMAGNSADDSGCYIDPDATAALTLDEIRECCEITARQMAGEYGGDFTGAKFNPELLRDSR